LIAGLGWFMIRSRSRKVALSERVELSEP
jgi:hypothetical protein